MEDLPPIPLTSLKDLFEHLERTSMTGYECDHTFSLTREFLRRSGLTVEVMLEWLGENGAGCDCEIMFNTCPQWEEAVGYVGLDEEDA